MEPIIGIDLGTTNSAVSIVKDGTCVVIPDSNGKKSLPSAVGFSGDGRLLVGEEARRQFIAAPESTVKSAKRKMGTDHQYAIGAKSYSPAEVSAIILKTLKQRAEKYLKTEVKKAVITVPAYFTDAQRQATKNAGEIAGLEVSRIINEPTAAAVAYQFGSSAAEKVLVYDLGGGTFDVSIVEIEDNVTEVLASHGNNHLGGDDFDNRLMNTLEERFHEKHNIYLTDSPVSKARLTRLAENAKIALSSHVFHEVRDEFIEEKDGVPLHLKEKIERAEFEKLIEPLIEETLTAIDKALGDAKIQASDLDRIILVGGSTKIPMVRRKLEERLGQKTFDVIDPDLCVAMGAGYYAAVRAGADIESYLVDVTPFSLGVRAIKESHFGFPEDYFSVIIPRNTVVPCSRSEEYTNPGRNPEKLEVEVYQGEQQYIEGNVRLGSFHILDLPRAEPGELRVEVHFDFDLNGILKVTAREKNSGKNFSIKLTQSTAKLDAKQVTKAKELIDDLFDSAVGEWEEPEELNPIPDDILNLCEEAEKIAEKIEDQVEKSDILSLIDDIKMECGQADSSKLEPMLEELKDIIYYHKG